MRGKYSPTVTAAYMADQEWWVKYTKALMYTLHTQYDPEGYDSYGYNKDDIDRAGNNEYEYYHNDCSMDDNDYNWKYDDALGQWGFDGVKPVKK